MSDKKVPVSSLNPADFDGYLTKQGGSIKTWKKRWFVLKNDHLYYFKSPKESDLTGDIKLEATTACNPEPIESSKKKFYFSVGVPGRKYLIYADSEENMLRWVDKIKKAIESQKKPIKTDPPIQNDHPKDIPIVSAPVTPVITSPPPSSEPATPLGDINIISKAKNVIPFLLHNESKVLEFWKIWFESIPAGEATPGTSMEYHIVTTPNMQKLTWKTAGPQNIFIQRMVDFFWNVGAPDSEIDRLNDIGGLINPLKIGSWIEMSEKGGMDGGWYFPVEIPLKMAVEASDSGDPTHKVTAWATKHNIEKAYSVGRDMGAAPPRQTEIRIRLPGNDFQQQLNIGLDAFSSFGFPAIPENAESLLKESNTPGLCLSIITSSEGFVRLGILAPKPSKSLVQKLCSIVGSNADNLNQLENVIGSSGPSFVEFQYLNPGFGYGVYKEGFDIVFHYSIGEEGSS